MARVSAQWMAAGILASKPKFVRVKAGSWEVLACSCRAEFRTLISVCEEQPDALKLVRYHGIIFAGRALSDFPFIEFAVSGGSKSPFRVPTIQLPTAIPHVTVTARKSQGPQS